MIDMLSGATIGELFTEIAQVERKIAGPKQVPDLPCCWRTRRDSNSQPSDP